MSAPIDKLLSRLEGVKKTGAGRWIARCPAHEDRRPSLSIRETDDGRILVHCFGGCSASDVVDAAGLSLADLFERPISNLKHLRPRERFVPSDVWQCVAFEAAVAHVAASDVAAGRPISQADAKRAALAAERLADALKVMGVSQ